jgi:hypothetical protein
VAESDAGVRRTGRLANVAGGAWGLGPRKPPLGARAQSDRAGRGGARCGDPTDGSACKRGRKGLGPGATQAAPRRSRPIGGGCCPTDCHSLRRWVPTSHSATPLHTQTSTEENGSGWPAQRLGGRLVVCRRVEPAERVPIASTAVATRSPCVVSRSRAPPYVDNNAVPTAPYVDAYGGQRLAMRGTAIGREASRKST